MRVFWSDHHIPARVAAGSGVRETSRALDSSTEGSYYHDSRPFSPFHDEVILPTHTHSLICFISFSFFIHSIRHTMKTRQDPLFEIKWRRILILWSNSAPG